VARWLAPLLLFAAAARLAALDVPPKPEQWVNDYGAQLFTPDETQQLNDKIERLRERTGAQLLVMIWPSLQGADPLEFTDRVANMWKVEDDRALMLFVFVRDRKTFIKVGRGLEPVITDAYASDVYRNALVPQFRQRQFYAGIDMAIDQLAAKIDPGFVPPAASPPPPSPVQPLVRPPAQPRVPVPDTSGVSLDDVLIVGFVLLALLAIVAVIFVLRRSGGGGGISPRSRSDGGTTMFYANPLDMTGGTNTDSGWSSGFSAGGFSAGDSSGGGSSVGGSWGGGGDSSFNGGGAGGSW